MDSAAVADEVAAQSKKKKLPRTIISWLDEGQRQRVRQQLEEHQKSGKFTCKSNGSKQTLDIFTAFIRGFDPASRVLTPDILHAPVTAQLFAATAVPSQPVDDQLIAKLKSQCAQLELELARLSSAQVQITPMPAASLATHEPPTVDRLVDLEQQIHEPSLDNIEHAPTHVDIDMGIAHDQRSDSNPRDSFADDHSNYDFPGSFAVNNQSCCNSSSCNHASSSTSVDGENVQVEPPPIPVTTFECHFCLGEIEAPSRPDDFPNAMWRKVHFKCPHCELILEAEWAEDEYDPAEIANQNDEPASNDESDSGSTPRHTGGRKKKRRSRNPNGRPVGSSKKIARDYISAEEHGYDEYISRRRAKMMQNWDAQSRAEHNGSLMDVLDDVLKRDYNVASRGDVRGADMLECLVDHNDKIKNLYIKQGADGARESMSARKALKLKFKTGMGYRQYEFKCQLEGRKGIDPNTRQMMAECKELYKEVDQLLEIESLAGDVQGVSIDLAKAQKILLADLESQGLIDKDSLPEEIIWRFSFDGTKLKNGHCVVVVGIVPINLNCKSSQSTEMMIPVALLRHKEDHELLKSSLSRVMDDMMAQQNDGIDFHGHRSIVWSQSYDLASWWKILRIAWNAKVGCCPFCQANNTNLHQVHTGKKWKNAILTDEPHPWSFIPISMMQSGYCPLHAELRLWGDSFMDKLAQIADDNGELDNWIEVCRDVVGYAFNAEKDSNGHISTTALQGGPCKKLRERYQLVIDATGVGNEQKFKEHVDNADIKKQCQAMLQNRCRCQKNKERGKQFCSDHEKKRHEKKGRLIMSSPEDNVQIVWRATELKDHLYAVAETMNVIFPKIQQNYAYNDDQYQVLLPQTNKNRHQKEVELTIPKCELLVQNSKREWQPIGEDSVEEGAMVKVKASFNKQGSTGREGHICSLVATADEQMKVLDEALQELAAEWNTCFGDEGTWTAYLHIVVAHTMVLMRIHKQIGKFSNSVLETFHKQIRWLYGHTNREGYGGDESSREIMHQYYAIKILDIESRNEYSFQMIHSLKHKTASCDCQRLRGIHADCGWHALRNHIPKSLQSIEECDQED